MAQTEKKWYVLRASSGKEAKVKEYLDAEIKHDPLLEKHVSQVVLPLSLIHISEPTRHMHVSRMPSSA